MCAVFFLLVQGQLFHASIRPGGSLGTMLAHLVLRGQQPAEPDVWFQVSAPIAKTMMGGVRADVRQRAEPVVDWLTEIDGIQQAELARFMLAGGDLLIDLTGLDETGCQRIMAATGKPGLPIDLIAVTATSADVIAVPTTTADLKQCDRKTAYLRMLSHAHPAHDQH